MIIKDVFGDAIKDFFKGEEAIIDTYSSIGGWDKLPVSYLFRSYVEMPKIEQVALDRSFGSVLDIGCGAGSHSLFLQEKGLDITAIDISAGGIETCKKRGVKNAIQTDLWNHSSEQYDTILSLMNGIGLCGSIDLLPSFLSHLKSLLKPDGQILVDSSDIIYMYEDEQGVTYISDLDRYYGEVDFKSKYKDQCSAPYPWLYLDFYNLQQHAYHIGLDCELILQGPHYDYLARLTHSDVKH